MIGVAISTTGHAHRMKSLRSSVVGWQRNLPLGSRVIVTVDGDGEDRYRVLQTLDFISGVEIYQVDTERRGVAANKNTGIEILYDAGAEHILLSDDDCWPLRPRAITTHTELGLAHSMVCWGRSRLIGAYPGLGYAEWNWPRGVMIYSSRAAIETVGGMYETFGIGGHEHVEWSRRMCAAGLTAEPFMSPAPYAAQSTLGAARLWHCTDMPQFGEPAGIASHRKRANTTIPTKSNEEWDEADALLEKLSGSTRFVPFTSEANGRDVAILGLRA